MPTQILPLTLVYISSLSLIASSSTRKCSRTSTSPLRRVLAGCLVYGVQCLAYGWKALWLCFDTRRRSVFGVPFDDSVGWNESIFIWRTGMDIGCTVSPHPSFLFFFSVLNAFLLELYRLLDL